MQNKQILLIRRPERAPRPADFAVADISMPEIKTGEILIAHRFIGLQPAARIRMSEGDSYAPPTPLGGVPYGPTVGSVVRSCSARFKEGDTVVSNGGWQTYSIAQEDEAYPLDPRIDPPSYGLGVLGASGMTAYVGLGIAQPRAGQTVVVSAATGAVGSVAGQLAKLKGCRVVGIASGEDKCRFAVQEYGFADCIDRKRPDFKAALAQACPDGIDIDFENAGGGVRDAVYELMNNQGRILLCGLISEYDAAEPVPGPSWRTALVRRLSIQGFMLRDHLDRRQEFAEHGIDLVRCGLLKTREDITDGIERAPAAFIDMLNGKNFGKALIRI